MIASNDLVAFYTTSENIQWFGSEEFTKTTLECYADIKGYSSKERAEVE